MSKKLIYGSVFLIIVVALVAVVNISKVATNGNIVLTAEEQEAKRVETLVKAGYEDTGTGFVLKTNPKIVSFTDKNLVDRKIIQDARENLTYKAKDIYGDLVYNLKDKSRFKFGHPANISGTLDFLFENRKGSIKTVWCEWEEEVTVQEPIIRTKEICQENKSGESCITDFESGGTRTVTKTVKQREQFPCDLPANVKQVDLVPEFNYALHGSKWGVDVEWYPNLTYTRESKKESYVNYDWATWNTSCTEFAVINVTHDGSNPINQTVRINGSQGFDIGYGNVQADIYVENFNSTVSEYIMEFNCGSGDPAFYVVDSTRTVRQNVSCDTTTNCTAYNGNSAVEGTGYWYLNDGTDATGNSNTLTAASGSLTHFTDNLSYSGGGGVTVHGDTNAGRPYRSALNFTGGDNKNFTFVLQAYWNYSGGALSSNGGDSADQKWVQWSGQNRDLDWQVNSGPNYYFYQRQVFSAPGLPSTGDKIFCIVGRGNDTHTDIFLDGIEQDSDSNTNRIDGESFYLGTDSSGNRNWVGQFGVAGLLNERKSDEWIARWCQNWNSSVNNAVMGPTQQNANIVIERFEKSPSATNVSFGTNVSFFVQLSNVVNNNSFGAQINLTYPNGSIIQIANEVIDINGSINTSYVFDENPGDFGDWTWTLTAQNTTEGLEKTQNEAFTIVDTVTDPTFQVPNQNITLVGTEIELFCNGATITKTGGTVNYELYGDTSTTPTTLLSNTTDTKFNFTGLNVTTYYVRCRANDGAGAQSEYTPTYSISTASVFTDSCTTTNSTHALVANITYYNENNGSRIFNVENEATLYFWGTDKTINNTILIDQELTNSTLICVSPPDSTVYSDGKFQYQLPSHDPREFYFINRTLDNVTDNLSFYGLDITLASEIIFEVQDESDNPLPGFYIEVLREDLGTNTFPVVAMMKTDTNGKDNTFLRKADVFYRFIVKNYTTTVHTSTETKITEDSLLIRITPSTQGNLYQQFRGLSNVFTLASNATHHTLTATYSDPTAETQNCTLGVRRFSNASSTDVGDNSLVASSGSVAVTFANVTGDYYGALSCFIDGDTQVVATTSFSVTAELGNLATQLGATGPILAFFLVLTFAFIGAFSPAIAIMLTIVSIAALVAIGFWQIGVMVLGGIIIVGIIAMIRSD